MAMSKNMSWIVTVIGAAWILPKMIGYDNVLYTLSSWVIGLLILFVGIMGLMGKKI